MDDIISPYIRKKATVGSSKKLKAIKTDEFNERLIKTKATDFLTKTTELLKT